jgi:hypothetical protein
MSSQVAVGGRREHLRRQSGDLTLGSRLHPAHPGFGVFEARSLEKSATEGTDTTGLFELTDGLTQSGVSDGKTAALISQLVSPSAGLGRHSPPIPAKAARSRAAQEDYPCIHRICGIQRGCLKRAHQVMIDADRHGWPDPRHAGAQPLPIFFGPHSSHADADGHGFRQTGFQGVEVGLQIQVRSQS